MMTLPRHIYFLAPEDPHPRGGINVIFDFVELLNAHGRSASVHFQSSDFFYRFHDGGVRTTYSLYRDSEYGVLSHLRTRMEVWRRKDPISRRAGCNELLIPGDQDIIVVPEYWYLETKPWIAGFRHVILGQDVVGMIRGVFQPISNGMELPDTCLGFITTSKAGSEAVSAFYNGANYHVPLFINDQTFAFQAEKSRTICFLPRKRKADATFMASLIRNRPELASYTVKPIANVTSRELRKIMAESLFFLSFSSNEGFGLPPAEAMAMGCITIGYRGVGGNEYFTRDVGFPIPEDDFVAFYRTIIEVVEEYEVNSTRLECMRQTASKSILSTYTKNRTTKALLGAFDRLFLR